MSRIGTITTNKNLVSFVFKKSTTSEANLFRRSLRAFVEVIAIDNVEFIVNNTSLSDEEIALRLGLLPINMDEFEIGIEEVVHVQIVHNRKRKYVFDTSNIPNVSFTHKIGKGERTPEFPILEMLTGQELEFYLRFRRGYVADPEDSHSKYRAVGNVCIKEVSNGHEISFKTCGKMNPKDLIKAAMDSIPNAASEKKPTLYTNVVS